MDNNFLISIAFPGDTFHKFVQEMDDDKFPDFEGIDELKSLNFDDTTIERTKSIIFYTYLTNIGTKATKSAKGVLMDIWGNDSNHIHPKYFAEVFFNPNSVENILQLLKSYDNAYFWEAFGISLDKGNAFLKRLNCIDEHENTLYEIRNEIINSHSVKNEIVINEIFNYYYYCSVSNIIPDDIAYFLLTIYEIALKYPSIKEALYIFHGDDWHLEATTLLDNISFNKKQDELNPEFIFELIKIAHIFCNLKKFVETINNYYSDDTLKMILLYSFKSHEYGYEAYQVYLYGCKKYNLKPLFDIGNNPELYFYNSYKVPQLPSLCKRYFDDISEKDAKDRTQNCFIQMFENLIEVGFLDRDCRKEEFLWAFGLTDQYPYAFKKIKFYTLTGKNKKGKGNGAFLCFLNILGYKSQEIKQMLHRNPDKSLINKTFDLTIKDNTIMSKDYNALLEIVKSSGLPIIETK